MEVLADQYQLRNQEATFTGSVQVRDPQWNLSCDRLDLRLGEGRKIKGFLARGQVRAEQKAAGGQVAGAPGWQLECEALEAFMAAPGEQLEKMVGRGKVHLRQLAEPSKEARAPQWLLTAEEVALEMAPGAARLQRVVADGQVQVQQRETLADGRWDRHWTLDCLHLELGLSPEGHQLREAEARGKVALEEAANWTPPRLPIKMRCEAATLRLGSGTNQMEYLEGREGVVIEQGLTRATAEKATVHGTNAQVELTGKPFLHLVNPKKAPAGVAPSAVLAEEPQALEISGAEVLTWDRVTNRFGGKGLYKIVRCLPPGKSEP
jgi:lipopolysaccharide export system protein LptA